MKHWKVHGLLLFTALISSFNYSVSKIIMPEFVLPAAIIVIRGVSASLFFWALHLSLGLEKIDYKNDFPRIVICAFFGIACNQLLFFEGLNLTTPINASLLQCSIPVFVLIVSAFMLREKVTWVKIAGICMAASGAILLLLHSASASASDNASLGDVFIILNALSYSFFLVLVKPLMAKYDGLTIVAWVFALGSLMTFPFGYDELIRIQWTTMPAYALWSLAFIVIFSTIITYYLNISVLKYIAPSIAGIYMYIQPVLATLIAVWLGKDHLTLEKALYSLVILAGVYMVSVKR